MVTTIQISERTLEILRKLKEDIDARSYDEAIAKVVNQRNKKKFKSMAGSLGGYLGEKSTEDILKELQDERRKSDRL